MEPFHSLVDVRPDVRNGTLDQSAYAASLGDVAGDVDKPAAREYRDPELFKRMTYETDGMRRVLEDIRVRLHEGKGNGVRQIETSFGGGKTHAMIAMYHRCLDWSATPVVIDGQTLDVQNTIWGEIERQLDGRIRTMTDRTAPSGTRIYELLHGRDKPVLLLMDEMFNYVANAAGVAVGNSDLAAQTITFMQRLNGQMGSLPNVCLVMSLSDRDDVLEESGMAGAVSENTARRQNEYYTKLQNIAGRHRQLVTVSDYNDISHIVRRRLFDTSEDIIRDRARKTISWCTDSMKAGGSLLSDDAADYAERFGDTYPFTPDVIRMLHERWGSHPTFQRTRGVLRLLSLVVHTMLKSDRAWIAPGDVDLSIPEIRKELLKHIEDNAESVIIADIVGNNAGAKSEGAEGVRCASCVFMYSFPSSAGGATEAEVKRGVFTHDTSHSVVGDIMGKLRRRLFYLKLTDNDMLLFDVRHNLNYMIDQTVRNVPDVDVRAEELERLRAAVQGDAFADVVIWPDATESGSVPDRPELQLVVCRRSDPEWCGRIVNGTVKSRRINMNGLVFLLPSDGMALGESLRRYLAMLSIQKRLSGTLEYTAATRARIESEMKRAEQGIGGGLRTKYSAVYLPAEGGTVAISRDYTFNPAEDGGAALDHLLWNRLVREDQIAVRMAPDIAKKYGSDADSAYETMIRMPGVVMPASLEVVRNAFKAGAQPPPRPDPDPGPSPDPTPPPDPDPTPQPPEKMYEHMMYTDAVDAVGLNVIRSMLLEPADLSLTEFDCRTTLRPDGMYDVRVEMKGRIPDRVVSSIRPTARGHVDIDGGWDE